MSDDREPHNIFWHSGAIKKDDRRSLLDQHNKVIWFTGLSGSGKSTLANAVECELHKRGVLTYVLDGDNVRHGLNSDLGFSATDREENIRRVGEVARILHDAGVFVLVSFISPTIVARNKVRDIIGDDFIEVFVECPLTECEQRDTKGLYKKARANIIGEFTGISAPYEIPENPEIVINTDGADIQECVDEIVKYLENLNK